MPDQLRTLSPAEAAAIENRIIALAPKGLSEADFTRWLDPRLAAACGEAEASPAPLDGGGGAQTASGLEPAAFRLYPGTVDAARGAVTLRFDLPRASDVTLELYDIGGRRIDQLRLGPMGAGRQEWTSARLELPSAMLFYRLRAGDLVATGKVPFVR